MLAFTHQQVTEPTVYNKSVSVPAVATVGFLKNLIDQKGKLKSCSGKMGGATGNMICHYAAFSGLD